MRSVIVRFTWFAALLLALALCASGEAAQTPSYDEYQQIYGKLAQPCTSIALGLPGARAEQAERDADAVPVEQAADAAPLRIPFQVEEAGLYQLEFEYKALPARRSNIEVTLLLDGALPFKQAEGLIFRRLFDTTGEITRDSRGHDVRPLMQEAQLWQTVRAQDFRNHFAEPYFFYLSQGTHELTIRLTAERWALRAVRFVPGEKIPDYATYASAFPKEDVGESFVKEAERAALRNSEVIYAVAARGEASVSPCDPVKTRLNTIGGYSWKQQGEWIEWQINCPQNGWYALEMHLINDFVRGMPATRRLYVDGGVPFTEAKSLSIPYVNGWQYWTLRDDEGALLPLYLTEGSHVLRLEVTSGQNAPSLRRLEDILVGMNRLYRDIIVITGDNADGTRLTIDMNRDFHLEKKIPGLLDTLRNTADALREEHELMKAYAGRGSEAALLEQAAIQLDSFIDRPDLIPTRLESYKGNLSSLSSWVLYMREQPLQIDDLRFVAKGDVLRGGAGIAQTVSFRWQSFTGSFTENYNAVGEVYDAAGQEPLKVWVCANDLGATGISSGRDQTQLIKELIDQLFVPSFGVPVNVSLIDGSATLMQATLGGKGPDVAMTVYKELPVNLAMRGALLDFMQFPGMQDKLSRWHESALVPYRYRGGLYALPETQSFDMIFYRKDILSELGVSLPETWEDLRALVPVLQKRGMQIGIAAPTVTNNNTSGFQTQLFQRGLNFYNEDLSATTFDRPAALQAFKAWTELYTKYSLPVQYDLFSRFRTGEMPIAIANYTMANTLSAAAPELNGVWDLAPVPGTRLEDGSIDRSEGATGTSLIILADTRHPQKAYDFASWWTSSEVQAQFGLALESLMGSSARWPTANREAFLRIKWNDAQQKALLRQWEDLDDIPQLPGNYITNRNLAFAFRMVVYQKGIPREVLNRYNREINKEIERKWEEFGK